MARPRQVSDEDILAAARRCFLAHGPSVSTTAIAEEVGLSQATLFKRFGTKQQLMIHAMAPPSEPEWILRVEKGPDGRPVPVQLREMGLEINEFFKVLIPCLMVLKATGLDPEEMLSRYEKPPPMRAREAMIAWFQALIDEGRARRVDAQAVAMAFLGGIQSRFFMSHVMGFDRGDDEAHVDHLVDVIWTGVRP